ncbi:MAG: hypothetical protein OEZ65_00455 [Gemmatimonadota bacterium]|nr:hypothetical protein [Gemmatimonadota bacterium]MDH5758024.1 hypothetical protein [Gemmatimonadota bacterium]
MSGRKEPEPFRAWEVPPGARDRLAGHAAFDGVPGVLVPALDPASVREIVDRLAAARDALHSAPVREIARHLGRVGERFLDPGGDLRADALSWISPFSGLSPDMAAAVLDGMASGWTVAALSALLDAEFRDPSVLDRFLPSSAPRLSSLRAMGPRFCFQVVAGSVPGVGTTALIRSLLVKSPTLVKPGLGDVALPVLFLRALREEAPALADAAAVLYWTGGDRALEDAVLGAADLTVVYGGDETVKALRDRMPPSSRLVAYHHRVGFGIVGREGLGADEVGRVVTEVAGSVAFFDQRGCVSPHVVYVEDGGSTSPSRFAALVAGALDAVGRALPIGDMDEIEVSAVQQLRGTAEMLSAAGKGVELHTGRAASWTVVLDPGHDLNDACVGRVVLVRPVADAGEVPALVAPRGAYLQTAGVAGCGTRTAGLAEALARVGVTRVTDFGGVAFPPPWWLHDGEGPLRALLRWTESDV